MSLDTRNGDGTRGETSTTSNGMELSGPQAAVAEWQTAVASLGVGVQVAILPSAQKTQSDWVSDFSPN